MVPFAIAQEEQEASLGEEEESLADSIVSDVLDDQNVAVVDQDNTANQDAANVGLQEEEAAQEQEQEQEAANLNVDSDVQRGEQSPPLTEPSSTQPPGPIRPPGTPGPIPPPPPPDDDGEPPVVEPPRENGKIAFASNIDDGNYDIM